MLMLKKLRRVCFAFVCCLHIVGCQEEGIEAPPPDNNAGCKEQSLLGSLSTIGQHTGVSALQLINKIGQERMYKAQYATENKIIEQSPLGGETDLFLNMDLNDASAIEFYPGEGVTCPSRLEVSLDLMVKTSDGAFDETWPVKLVYSPGSTTTLTGVYDPENISGEFQVVRIIESTNSDTVMSGRLSERFEIDHTTGEIAILLKQHHENSDDLSMDIGTTSIQRVLTWDSSNQ